jgi:outer membrane protein OmpA-like peptidoglycan-associated protein
MVIGKAPSCRRGTGAKARKPALRLAIAALLIGLGACSPVEAYRDLMGVSKNDPNPQTTPNTKNLAAGEASDYPNLATVPPPPSRALTTAERDKLTQSLIADRANAKYTSEKLQAGFAEASAPPPPPAPPGNEPAATPKAAQTASAAAAPSATAASAGAAPSSGKAAGAAPAAPASGQAAGTAASAAPAAAATGLRKAGEPPEPGPMESSLQSPQISSLPNPQQNEPAPPPPRELRLPAASAAANAPPAAAHLPAPPAPAPMPAAIASAKFEPPPPPPVLPPTAPAPTAAATGSGKSAGKPATAPPVDTRVAEIKFPAGATTLSDADRQTLDKIVPLYRQDPGKVRVVGYAGVGSSAVDQLNGYRAALDRAQAVAAGLTQAGIPSDKVLVEAAPAGADSGQSRAEVLFEH